MILRPPNFLKAMRTKTSTYLPSVDGVIEAVMRPGPQLAGPEGPE